MNAEGWLKLIHMLEQKATILQMNGSMFWRHQATYLWISGTLSQDCGGAEGTDRLSEVIKWSNPGSLGLKLFLLPFLWDWACCCRFSVSRGCSGHCQVLSNPFMSTVGIEGVQMSLQSACKSQQCNALFPSSCQARSQQPCCLLNSPVK